MIHDASGHDPAPSAASSNGLPPQMKIQLPEAVTNFLSPKCSEEVLALLKGQDVEQFMLYFDELTGDGKIPKDWPTPNLLFNDQGLYGGDIYTQVLITAINSSDSEAATIEHLPDSARKVRDWMWFPAEGLTFVWEQNTSRRGLSAVTGPPVEALKELYESMRTLTPGLIPHQGEPTMANLLTGFIRGIAMTYTDKAEIDKILENVRACSGFSATELIGASEAFRRTTWNHLLARSPAYRLTKLVVSAERKVQGPTGVKEAFHPEVFMCAVLHGIDELEDEPELLRKMAIQCAETNGWTLSDNSPIVYPDTCEAFSLYADKAYWGHLPISEWMLSPNALERVKEWDELIMSAI